MKWYRVKEEFWRLWSEFKLWYYEPNANRRLRRRAEALRRERPDAVFYVREEHV